MAQTTKKLYDETLQKDSVEIDWINFDLVIFHLKMNHYLVGQMKLQKKDR